ncbi:hypothetical protein EVAR_61496_1 [Eumeta japonica]|uniref:Uncharacterized protein n=1 Tax=Eumeta variegata TaxID=151549 RepID=A0A4C2A2L7_EUMVA|nr:hypothetical protein EVAR_61496_1 [Eumeta japonica]
MTLGRATRSLPRTNGNEQVRSPFTQCAGVAERDAAGAKRFISPRMVVASSENGRDRVTLTSKFVLVSLFYQSGVIVLRPAVDVNAVDVDRKPKTLILDIYVAQVLRVRRIVVINDSNGFTSFRFLIEQLGPRFSKMTRLVVDVSSLDAAITSVTDGLTLSLGIEQ